MERSFAIPTRIDKQLSHFTGREWLLKKIDKWLKDDDGERIFVLTGKPGAGKSMVAAWLCGGNGLALRGESGGVYANIRERIRAAYFFVARDNVSPREFALEMSEQLFTNLPGFSDALAKTMPDKKIPKLEVNIRVNENQGKIIGAFFNEFNAGDLDDEPSFDRLLRLPLKQLYKSGCKEKTLLVLDGLDEAMTYTGQTKVVALLNKLLQISPLVRLFATTRPDPDVLDRFPSIEPFDLTGPESDKQDDLSRYVKNRLAALPEVQRDELADEIIHTVDGNFLFASLVIEDLLPQIKSSRRTPSLRLPKSLNGLYARFLDREVVDEETFLKEDKPVLSMIAIGQGPGLTSELIECFSGVLPEAPLRKYKQYLDGDLPEGPFRPFHKSLTDFLLDEKNRSRFKVEPGGSHRKIVDYYCGEAGCLQQYPTWDDYGINYIFAHFTDAVKNAKDANTRNLLTQRLVRLLGDPAFAVTYEARLKDLALMNLRRAKSGEPVLYQAPAFIEAWQNNLEMALRTASLNDHPDGALPEVDVALRLSAFRHQLLRTDLLFQLAKDGSLEEAEYRLNYFNAETRWQQAALLLFAWLAAGNRSKQKQAAALVARIEPQLVKSWSLDLLLKWVKIGLEGKDTAPDELPALPHAPQEGEAINIVMHVANQTLKNVSYLSEMEYTFAMDAKSQMDNPEFFANPEELSEEENIEEMPAYLGYEHGPSLVAFLKRDLKKGAELLQQYIDAHAANGYVYYRNRSLWGLMMPILSYPDAKLVRRFLTNLLSAALSASTLDFKEGLATALLGMVGQPDPWQALQERKGMWEKETLALFSASEWGDAWGSHARRYATLAETEFCLFKGQSGQEPEELLKAAMQFPRGFAGFRAPALVALAEAMMICGIPDALVDQAMGEAYSSACNITDPVFCMRMTSRVRAIQAIVKESRRASFDPYTRITAFFENPQGRPGAALHQVGNQYPNRVVIEGQSLPLPELCYKAETFEQLKLIYQQPFREFVRLNPRIDSTAPIGSGKTVLVPDPDFTPMLAVYYCALALSHSRLNDTDRRRLIQQLVPLTITNPTSLDTAMARLILAGKPRDFQAIDRMFQALRHKIGY